MHDLDKSILERRSVRGFLPDALVPNDTLKEVLQLAQHTPSNCNVQPWRVFVAEGARRDTLSQRLLAELDGGNFGNPDDRDKELGEFVTMVYEQDQPVVESQRPEELPENLSEEMHIGGIDTFSIDYRRWLLALADELEE